MDSCCTERVIRFQGHYTSQHIMVLNALISIKAKVEEQGAVGVLVPNMADDPHTANTSAITWLTGCV